MTNAEFLTALQKGLGVSVYKACDLLGISRSQTYNYANGKSAVPERVALHLKALVALKRKKRRERNNPVIQSRR